ncbi:MAG: MFS transporter [Oligoflexales bacterium]|nr:MFS transporter [Oligoflexales bacterium]
MAQTVTKTPNSECQTVLEKDKRTSLLAISTVSFLWSTSSLMVFSVLPAFLSEELGVNNSGLGMIEGLALFLSFLAKVFAGFASDLFVTRRPLIMTGSLLTALTKMGFVLITGFKSAFLVRFLDRFSKGIRSAPTDALLADLGSGPNYGFVFGLRQSLYTGGAVCGALLSMMLLYFFGSNYQLIFLVATIPSVLAVFVLAKGVKEKTKLNVSKARFRFSDLKLFSNNYWILMLCLSFLMLARFSEAFITLRVRELGLQIQFIPMVIVVMDVVHLSAAYPLGKWADQVSREKMLCCGMFIQLLAALTFANVSNLAGAFLGVVLIGLYMGMTQGVLRAIIAQQCPKHLRGSGFALFYLFSGVSVFGGNFVAGQLGDEFGLYAVFVGGAVFTALALGLYSIQLVLKSGVLRKFAAL